MNTIYQCHHIVLSIYKRIPSQYLLVWSSSPASSYAVWYMTRGWRAICSLKLNQRWTWTLHIIHGQDTDWRIDICYRRGFCCNLTDPTTMFWSLRARWCSMRRTRGGCWPPSTPSSPRYPGPPEQSLSLWTRLLCFYFYFTTYCTCTYPGFLLCKMSVSTYLFFEYCVFKYLFATISTHKYIYFS